jgi:hypothetical protein
MKGERQEIQAMHCVDSLNASLGFRAHQPDQGTVGLAARHSKER